MRKSLAWTLIVTLSLSAAAVWWPHSGPALVAHVEGLGRDALVLTSTGGAVPVETASAKLLPPDIEAYALEPAERNPFVPVQAAQAMPAASPAPKPAEMLPERPALVPQSPGPVTPATSHRYIGQMTDPEGRVHILLAMGDVAVLATAGQQLRDGYVVQSIDRSAVRLQYPSTGTSVELSIPPPPDRLSPSP